MTDEKVLHHKKGKHWEFTLSRTSERERVEDVVGLLVLAILIIYFLMK